MPCADVGQGITTNKNSVSMDHSGHADEKHTDLCSPFCVCGCCGVHVLNFNTSTNYDLATVFSKIETAIPTYESLFASNFYGSIWQPPQIV